MGPHQIWHLIKGIAVANLMLLVWEAQCYPDSVQVVCMGLEWGIL